MVEMGRFCIHPDCRDPDILRVAWGAMARVVDDEGWR
jgi:L-ornithine Nalpha-acyltransferase